MDEQALLQPTPLQRMNIYAEYILPYINSASKGDEILFVSPSTFFGFYSLGAQNFVFVCDALKKAKQRGVKVKLLVDIHDAFTAKAAEGLLTFLVDGYEVKHFEGNVQIYYVLLYSTSGTSRLAEFLGENPLAVEYLPGIQMRPFGGIKGKILDDIPPRDAEALRLGFHQLWERSGRTIADVIVRYTPTYRARRDLLLYQSLTYLAALVIGVMTGIAFALQSQPTLSALAIGGWLAATLGTGLLGTILSNKLISKRFG